MVGLIFVFLPGKNFLICNHMTRQCTKLGFWRVIMNTYYIWRPTVFYYSVACILKFINIFEQKKMINEESYFI